MAHTIYMDDDGILRVEIIGDIDEMAVRTFLKDLTPYLEQATPESPLRSLFDARKSGRFSPVARHLLTELGGDPRIGPTAIINASRIVHVLVTFITKVNGEQNPARFFKSEQQALASLKAAEKRGYSVK